MAGRPAIVFCYLILALATQNGLGARTNPPKSSNKTSNRMAFMKLPGSDSYIPIFVHDLATSPAQASYQYKPPKNGYSYPKPTARTTQPPPIEEFQPQDEDEEQIDSAGSPPGVVPQKEAEQPVGYPAIGLETDEQIDSAGLNPDEYPPGVYDTPLFEQNPNDACTSNSASECTIPGTPGVDYPNYSEVPPSNFRCPSLSGYYGDTHSGCQSFHVCLKNRGKVRQYSFLCPNGTIFSQNDFVCAWWHDFNCEATPSLYHLNKQLQWDDTRVSLKQKMANLKRLARFLPGEVRINPLNFPQQLLPALSIRLPDSRQTFGLQKLDRRPPKDEEDVGGFIANDAYGRPKPPGPARKPYATSEPFYETETPGTVNLGNDEQEEDIQPGFQFPTIPTPPLRPRTTRPPKKSYPDPVDEGEDDIQPGGQFPINTPPPYFPPKPRTTRPPKKPSYPQPADEGEDDIQPGGQFPVNTPPPYFPPKPRTTRPPKKPSYPQPADEGEDDIQPGGQFPINTPPPYFPPKPRTTRPPKKPSYPQPVDEGEEDIQPGGSFPTTTVPPKYTKPRTTKPPKKYTPAPLPNDADSFDEQEQDIQPGGSFPTTTQTPKYVKPRPRITTPHPTYLPPNDAESMDEQEEDIQPGGSFPTTTIPPVKQRPTPPRTFVRPIVTTQAPPAPTSEIGFNVPDEGETDVQPGGQPEYSTTPRPSIPKQKPHYLPPVVNKGYPSSPAVKFVAPTFLGQPSYGAPPTYAPPPQSYDPPSYGPPPASGGYGQSYTLPLSSQERIFYQKPPGQVPGSQFDRVAIFLAGEATAARHASLQKDILQNGASPALGAFEPIRAVSYSFPPFPINVNQQQQIAQAEAQFQLQSQFDQAFEPYQVRSLRQSPAKSGQKSKSKPTTVAPRQVKRPVTVQNKSKSAPKPAPSRPRPAQQVRRQSRAEQDPMLAEGASQSLTSLLGPLEPPVKSIELQNRQMDLDDRPTLRPVPPRRQATPPQPSSRPPQIGSLDFLDSNEVIDTEPQRETQLLPVSLITPAPTPTLNPTTYQRFQEPTFENADSDGRVPVIFPEQLRELLLPEVVDPPELIRSRETFARTYISRDETPQRAPPPPPPPPPPPRIPKKPLPLKIVRRPHHKHGHGSKHKHVSKHLGKHVTKHVSVHRIHKHKPIERHPRQGRRNRYWIDVTKY